MALRSDYPARGGFLWALDWLCSTRVSDTSRLHSQCEHSMIQSNSSLSYSICSLRSYFNLSFGAWIRNCYTHKNYSVKHDCTNIAGNTTFSVYYCRVTPKPAFSTALRHESAKWAQILTPRKQIVGSLVTW